MATRHQQAFNLGRDSKGRGDGDQPKMGCKIVYNQLVILIPAETRQVSFQSFPQ